MMRTPNLAMGGGTCNFYQHHVTKGFRKKIQELWETGQLTPEACVELHLPPCPRKRTTK